MALFENSKAGIKDVRNFIPIDINLSHSNFFPLITRAEQEELLPVLGDDLYTRLNNYVNSSGSGSGSGASSLDDLLPYCQEVVAFMAGFKAVPLLQTKISDSGIQVHANDQMKSASQWQVANVERSLHEGGMNAINKLYKYLYSNRDSFEDWTASEAFIEFTELYLHTADQFNEILNIGGSYLTFVDMRPAMKRVQERIIKPILGKEFHAEMLEFAKGASSGSGSGGSDTTKDRVLQLIRQTMVFSAVENAVELVFQYSNGAIISTRLAHNTNKLLDQKASRGTVDRVIGNCAQWAVTYQEELRKYCTENVADLPTFKDGEAYDESNADDRDIDDMIIDTDAMTVI